MSHKPPFQMKWYDWLIGGTLGALLAMEVSLGGTVLTGAMFFIYGYTRWEMQIQANREKHQASYGQGGPEYPIYGRFTYGGYLADLLTEAGEHNAQFRVQEIGYQLGILEYLHDNVPHAHAAELVRIWRPLVRELQSQNENQNWMNQLFHPPTN